MNSYRESEQFPTPPYRYLSRGRQAYNFVTGVAVLGLICVIAAGHRIAYELGLAKEKRLD
jgi:hypothetical protein